MQKEMRFMAQGDSSPLKDLVLRAMEESGGKWSVAAMRAPGFKTLSRMIGEPEMRAAAPLPDRAQVAIDRAVVEVGMSRLTFVADLLSAGLTYTLTDPLSVTQLEWNSVNKVANAVRTMTPEHRTENFMPGLLASRLPIYLTLAGFELDIRTLRMSQRLGLPLDVAGIKSATRAVNEATEDAAINGAQTLDGQQLTVAGYTAPGLLNAPNAETQNLTAAAWTSVPVGATVFAEVQQMVAKLVANKKFGPYRLYVGTTIAAALAGDFKANGDKTTMQRLLEIPGLEAVRAADMITSGDGASPSIGAKAVLVQMTSDVVDIVTGQEPTVIPWTSLSGFTFHNLVMAIQIPRVRSDYDGNSGICIGTTA